MAKLIFCELKGINIENKADTLIAEEISGECLLVLCTGGKESRSILKVSFSQPFPGFFFSPAETKEDLGFTERETEKLFEYYENIFQYRRNYSQDFDYCEERPKYCIKKPIYD